MSIFLFFQDGYTIKKHNDCSHRRLVRYLSIFLFFNEIYILLYSMYQWEFSNRHKEKASARYQYVKISVSAFSRAVTCAPNLTFGQII